MTGIWILLSLAVPQTNQREAEKLAIETLAHDLGLGSDLVEVRSAAPVDWSDSSLGCPKVGEVYMQVITPGYRLSLQVDGQLFSVHVGAGSAIVCRKGEAPLDEPESPEILDLVVQARTDLAERLDVEPDTIELVAASEVVWPDESLGCPEPGKAYPQRSREGFFVRLRLEKRIYRYHAARGGAPFLCESRTRPPDGGKTIRPVAGATAKESFEAESENPIDIPEAPKLRELVTQARKDLATRLTVEPETIDVLEASEVVWRDASLGCPQPGKAYPQSTREGYRIRLRSGKRVYRYHSGQGGAPFLCESPAR